MNELPPPFSAEFIFLCMDVVGLWGDGVVVLVECAVLRVVDGDAEFDCPIASDLAVHFAVDTAFGERVVDEEVACYFAVVGVVIAGVLEALEVWVEVFVLDVV